MCRDQTWPAENMGPIHLWPGYLLTGSENFFGSERIKIETYSFYGENFPDLDQPGEGSNSIQSKQPKYYPTQPDQIFFDKKNITTE